MPLGHVLHKQEACPDPVMATHGILPHCPYTYVDLGKAVDVQIGEIARDLDVFVSCAFAW